MHPNSDKKIIVPKNFLTQLHELSVGFQAIQLYLSNDLNSTTYKNSRIETSKILIGFSGRQKSQVDKCTSGKGINKNKAYVFILNLHNF